MIWTLVAIWGAVLVCWYAYLVWDYRQMKKKWNGGKCPVCGDPWIGYSETLLLHAYVCMHWDKPGVQPLVLLTNWPWPDRERKS